VPEGIPPLPVRRTGKFQVKRGQLLRLLIYLRQPLVGGFIIGCKRVNLY
jgi:hypothetical protein